MTEHPITPPPELLEKWEAEVAHTTKDEIWHVAVQAARWGADQELEACRLWVSENCDIYSAVELIQFRRPKPPSLKEKALRALDSFEGFTGSLEEVDVIRHALEQLND